MISKLQLIYFKTNSEDIKQKHIVIRKIEKLLEYVEFLALL